MRGGGNNKLLSAVSRYAPLVWRPEEGCIACREAESPCLSTGTAAPEAFPKVLVYVRVNTHTAFLEHVLDSVTQMAYPRSRMAVVAYVAPSPSQEKYAAMVNSWLASDSMQGMLPVRGTSLQAASLSAVESYRLAVEDSLALGFDHLFYLDSKANINNTRTLAHLVMQQRPVIAPKLTEPDKYFSNFWGSAAGKPACRPAPLLVVFAWNLTRHPAYWFVQVTLTRSALTNTPAARLGPD